MLITCCGTALVGAAAWSLVGVVAMGSSSFAHGLGAHGLGAHASGTPVSGRLLPKPEFYLAERTKELPWDKHARVSPATRLAAVQARPVVLASLNTDQAKPSLEPDILDTEIVAKMARLDVPQKKAAPVETGIGSALRPAHPLVATAAPAPERFGPRPVGASDEPTIQLAYATPSQSGIDGSAFSAVLSAPSEDELAATPDPDTAEETAALPDHEDTPAIGPMPQVRPLGDQARQPADETERPETRQARGEASPKPEEAAKVDERETPKRRKLAYARPDDPENSSGSGFGQALRNIFGSSAKVGNGVAVYDITAAKVYMPDGSVLEAHSGIGKMADNPRYVNVKMTGPTPPHVYNLRMREALFHGVEAIRMLPIDGRNKHGRDGFLTHSYLLRGGRAESHGCVAFKDYPRFLNAFKQGKVKQIVVVPSGGRAAGLRVASRAG